MTKIDQFFLHFIAHIIRNSDLFNFFSISCDSWDISNNIDLFLTVCDNSVITYIKKFRFSRGEAWPRGQHTMRR
jgi:hypothetical protein